MRKLKLKYSSVYLSMDIETSKVFLNDETPFQLVYSVSVQIVDTTNGIITTKLFRTLEDFIDFVSSREMLSLINMKEKQRMLCFIHNLDYEFTFLRRIIGGEFLSSETELDDYGSYRSLSTIRDTHSPIAIIFERLPHIEFRCTYALSGKKLSKVAEEQFNKSLEMIEEREGKEFTTAIKPFIIQQTKKLDLDYDVVTYPWDNLSDDIVEYNHRDTIVPVRLINSMLEDGYTLEDLPLTKTSIVVKDRYEHTNKYYNERTNKGKNNNQLRQCTNRFLYHIPTYKQYMLECLTYYGGTTTCHPRFCNRLLRNVYSVDIKSSYPTVMVQESYPDYDIKYRKSNYENPEEYFNQHLKGIKSSMLINKSVEEQNVDRIRGYKGIFTFVNVRLKNDNVFPTHSIDKSLKQKVKQNSVFSCDGYKTFNGKLVSADKITFAFNNIGLDCFNLIYEYDDIICHELTTTTKVKSLPSNEITFVLEAFALKESLPKGSFEQRKQKENVNSTYGMKVQKMIKNLYSMNDGNIEVQDFYGNDLDEKEKEEIYNFHCKLVREQYGKHSKTNRLMKRWDIFSDGTYITDYARYNLLKMVVYLTEIGFQCVYTDTDSIKFTLEDWQERIPTEEEIKEVNELVDSIFNQYNTANENRNKNDLHFKQIKEWLTLSENNFNKITKLGNFELESGYKEDGLFIVKPYPYFKYLGAKKYAYIVSDGEKEEIKTTLAGCSDKNLPKAIITHSNRYGYDLHESMSVCFRPSIIYDEDVSGRTTAKYETRTKEELDKLYFYEQHVNEKGERIYNYDNKIYLKDLGQMGGVVIENTSYTLNLTKNDCNFLNIDYREATDILTIDGEIIRKNI